MPLAGWGRRQSRTDIDPWTRQEVFGPVITIIRAPDEDDALCAGLTHVGEKD